MMKEERCGHHTISTQGCLEIEHVEFLKDQFPEPPLCAIHVPDDTRFKFLIWERVDCSLPVGRESLPQVEEFKYLMVLSTSKGRTEREIDG